MEKHFTGSQVRKREKENTIQIGGIAICGSSTIVRSSSANRFGR